MKEVIEEALRLIEKNEQYVIATVVRTKGSTPQKTGAKLLIREDGSGVGTLGGGCVEGDIWYQAKEVLREQSAPVFRSYQLSEDIAARGGLVCGGTMYFFIDPILLPETFKPYASEIMRAYQGAPPVAVATVVKIPDSKTDLGAKLLISGNGLSFGSFNDKELEHEAVRIGQSIATYGDNKIFQAPDGTEVFVEGFASPPIFVLIGGGHVNKAVSRLADMLGFHVYIVDDRPEFANKERFPEAEDIFIAEYHEGLKNVPVNSNTYIIVATRGHRYDDIALRAAIQTPARFVGLLGSKRKTIEIYKNFIKEDNISPEHIREVRAPIGLNIGARTPKELAVSIIAEIIMVRRGGDGTPMKLNEKYLDKIIPK